MRYIERLADAVIAERLAGLPAILIVGPRATGKTTTARRHARSVVRLDRPAEAAAFVADPDAALRTMPEPALLDEWQAVPDVLGAVKRAVDDDPRPGRFILTGSVRADLTTQTWPGTGRVVRTTMHGLTRREVAGHLHGPSLIDRLRSGAADALQPPDPPDLPGYLELALLGGFPDAVLQDDADLRAAWLDSYLDQLLTRDAAALSDRDPRRMARYLQAVALNSAGFVTALTLYEAAGIDRKTAQAYDRLLTNLLVMDTLPAWTSNRLARLVKGGKRYLTDPSLMGAALHIDRTAAMRDGNLMGRLLDTFVAAQLRAEIDLLTRGPRLHHLRDKNGRHEVDLLAEIGADGVVAIEVKATASPGRADARHLRWLAEQLGDRFLAGAVLHTGPRSFVVAPKVVAAPIAALWAPPVTSAAG